MQKKQYDAKNTVIIYIFICCFIIVLYNSYKKHMDSIQFANAKRKHFDTNVINFYYYLFMIYYLYYFIYYIILIVYFYYCYLLLCYLNS